MTGGQGSPTGGQDSATGEQGSATGGQGSATGGEVAVARAGASRSMLRQGGVGGVASPEAKSQATGTGTGDRGRRETRLEPPATPAHKGGSHLASDNRRTMDQRPLRDTRFEIDLDLLAHNVRTVRRLLEDEHAPGERPRIAAVLKGDAYGFGAVQTAGVMLEEAVDVLAVACLPEALELRRRYPDAPIMIMGYTPDDLLPMAVEHRITLTLFQASQARVVSSVARNLGARVVSRVARHPGARAPIHITVEPGLNRLSLVTCYPFDAANAGGPLRYVVTAMPAELPAAGTGFSLSAVSSG